MTEVRISSQSERPSAGIEDTPEASIGTGGRGHQRHRKVHSLIDKVYDRSNLTKAWKHVRENKGSAGIDGLTIAAFTEREDELLARLHEQLRDRTYRPQAVKRVAIPKAGGGTRNLGIPTVLDRALQRSTAEVLTAIYEQDFLPCSFGGRPKLSAHHALATLNEAIAGGKIGWVLEADLKNFFGNSQLYKYALDLTVGLRRGGCPTKLVVRRHAAGSIFSLANGKASRKVCIGVLPKHQRP